MINVAACRELRDHLVAHAEMVNMGVWIVQDAATPECGTVACAAGWTCLLAGDRPWMPVTAADGRLMSYSTVLPHGGGLGMMSVGERARELLGLTYWQAEQLFYRISAESAVKWLDEALALAEPVQERMDRLSWRSTPDHALAALGAVL